MNNKITFPELVSLVAESTNTSPRMSELFLKELFATISQALIDGQNVSIKNLGTFEFVQAAARRVINVNTGQPMEVPEHQKLVFTPDKALAEAINQPFAAFEPIELSDNMTAEMLQSIDNGVIPSEAFKEEDSSVPLETAETTDSPKPTDTPEASGTPDIPEPPTANPPITPLSVMATPPPFSPIRQDSEPEPAPESIIEPESQTPEPETKLEAEPEPNTNLLDMKNENYEERTVKQCMQAEFEQAKHRIAHQSFLKGLVTGTLATLVLVSIIWAAWNSGRNSVISAREAVQADTIAEPVSKQSTVEETVATRPTESPVNQSQSAANYAVVTDTCTATMYLSKMSTKHYGKPDFWIYIYEENKAKIADPNNVTPGTVVVIPPASKYGIDSTDKASIDRARKRTYELLSTR